MIKELIAEILQIELSGNWDIYDAIPDEDLYLISYNQGIDVSKYGYLKNVIIDTKERQIIGSSFGFIPTILLDTLPDPNLQTQLFSSIPGYTIISPQGGGIFSFTDLIGRSFQVDYNRSYKFQGYEGVTICIFKHHGKTYYSANNRLSIKQLVIPIPILELNPSDQVNYEELFLQLAGTSLDNLPDDYYHWFAMITPDLLMASKEIINDSGYLKYLGSRKKSSTFVGNEPIIWLNLDSIVNDNISLQTNLTLEEANEHLRMGFHPDVPKQNDRRLDLGEFLYLQCFDDQNNYLYTLKVVSTPYYWRSYMRDNNYNLKYRLYQLMNGAYLDTENLVGRTNYEEKFPLLEIGSVEKSIERIEERLETEGMILTWPSGREIPLTKDERFANIWLDFLMAVPIHLQPYISVLYDEIMIERGLLIEKILTLEQQYENPYDYSGMLPRVNTLINQARIRTRNSFTQLDRTFDNKLSGDFRSRVAHILQEFIKTEEGGSLYNMVSYYFLRST